MNISQSLVKRSQEIKTKSFKRFNEWSKKYDRSVLQRLVFRNSHDMFIKQVVRDERPFRILDIGCGTGEFLLKLKGHRKDINIFGVDISSEMVNVAKKKLSPNKGMDFRVGDVEDMPYDSDYFDYVTCSHSFHHYPNKDKAVQEMHRVLKDDGKVMIIDGYKDNFLGRFIFDFIVKGHEVDVHHLHSLQFRNILTNSGFSNIFQIVFNSFIPLLFTKGMAKKSNEAQTHGANEMSEDKSRAH